MQNPDNRTIPTAHPGNFLAWQWRRAALGIAIVFWATFLTYLFIAPPEWALAKHPWLRPAGHYQLLMPYLGLVAGGGWTWAVSLETWISIGLGFLGLAAIMAAGHLFGSCFEIYMPFGARLSISFVLGTGLCGLVFTFVALAGFLYQWLALVIYFALIASLWISARHKRKMHLHPEFIGGLSPDEEFSTEVLYGRQQQIANTQEQKTWMMPREGFALAGKWIMVALLVLTTGLTFYHALFFPETYWDSLILYLGYARGIFVEHGFPVKVVGQVGVGLGANYPHLYELTGALIATWFNRWSPLYLQLASPLAGLFGILLVYHIALRLTRSVLISLSTALLVRSLPYLITYHIYATNYSFAFLFSAAFFYCALRYIEEGLPGYLMLAALCAAFSTHINYLMWALWICWFVMVIFAHVPRRYSIPAEKIRPFLPVRMVDEIKDPPYVRVDSWCGLRGIVRTRCFWLALGWGMVISSVWYLRNWIVTGNPVYAFFAGVFGGKHINPAVMASAAKEWQAHGDGIGVAGPALLDRIAFTWPFFVNNFSTSWKWAPVFMALVVPGVVVFLAVLFFQIFAPRRLPELQGRRIVLDTETRFGMVAFIFMGVLFAYHYVLGPYYLYHLLPATAVFAVFICFVFVRIAAPFRGAFHLFAILCGLMPGLPWSMMGAKLASEANTRQLVALRNPGMNQSLFYQLRFGGETRMWDYINRHARNTAILTHENRQALFDPSIRLVHMDDWEVQQVWGRPKREKLQRLKELGVRFYLRIPFEFDHPINKSLDHARWIEDGTLRKVFEAGDTTLYEFNY